MRGISRLATGIVFAISALSLSGCLVNRIQTVQKQACEFDENFKVSVSDGMNITFLNPVLLYDDVTFLAGLAPQLEKLAGNRYRASYVIRKVGDSDGFDIPINLVFEKQNDELKLAQASWQDPIMGSLDDVLLSQVADDACNTSLPLWPTRVEVPLPEFDRSIIPTREQLIELAGNPTLLSSDGNELQYHFVLEGANNDELTGSINLVYDMSGQNLLRTRTRFYYYVTGANFERGMAWGKIAL